MNGTAVTLLHALLPGERLSGYDLGYALGTSIDGVRYALGRLVADGLVETELVKGSTARGSAVRRFYRITPAGAALLLDEAA